MSIDDLKSRLSRTPFEPFTIELNDGDSAFIDATDRVLMLKSKLLIGSPNSDRFRSISLFDIDQIPFEQPVSEGRQ